MKKGGEMKNSKYICKSIAEELKGPLKKGEVPEIHVLSCAVSECWQVSDGKQDMRIHLYVVVNGKPAIVSASHKINLIKDEKKADRIRKNPAPYVGPSIPVELVDEAFRQAVKEGWPKLYPLLSRVKINSSSEYTLGDEKCHEQQVHIKVDIGQRKWYSLSGRGPAGHKLLVNLFNVIYRWLVWRLLCRSQPKKK